MNLNKRFLDDAKRAIRHKERYQSKVGDIAEFVHEHCECSKDLIVENFVEEIQFADDLPETAEKVASGEYINGNEDFFDMYIETGRPEDYGRYLVLMVTPEPFI